MPYQMACQEFVDIEYNKAKDGNRTAVEVKDGDWLILGSDGLFDNMYDEEIAALQVIVAPPSCVAAATTRGPRTSGVRGNAGALVCVQQPCRRA